MWNQNNKSEVACILAGIILNENKIKITDETLKKILNNLAIKIEKYWFFLFPKLSDKINFDEVLGISINEKTFGNLETKKIKENKEEKESIIQKESDEDMGFGLFD
jgi:ribosomal protein L12E/L44/L45/RPP1/RPP2